MNAALFYVTFRYEDEAHCLCAGNYNTAPGIDGVRNEILKEVIRAHPEILLEAFNSCLREGRFFVDWKKQRLVLLRKGNKPPGDAASYRPICLLDAMRKLPEELILQRRQTLLVKENGLSQNEFCFQKGIDIRNPFNTTRWNICIEAMVWKKFPDYLL